MHVEQGQALDKGLPGIFGLAEFAQHLADIAVRGGDFARHGGVLAQFAAQVFTQGEALPEVHQGFVEQAKVVQTMGVFPPGMPWAS